MRTLLKVVLPVEAANKAVTNGTLQKTVQTVTETLRPEAFYFTTENGRRTALFVVDAKDTTTLTQVTETLFQTLNAEITTTPAQTAEEYRRTLDNATKTTRQLVGAAH
jgi:hypothetical protein